MNTQPAVEERYSLVVLETLANPRRRVMLEPAALRLMVEAMKPGLLKTRARQLLQEMTR